MTIIVLLPRWHGVPEETGRKRQSARTTADAEFCGCNAA